jgi:peroxiredoxin
VQRELEGVGGRVMAISVDKPSDSKKVIERYGIPFDILSDSDRSTIKAYGLVHQDPAQGEIAHPANFLIGKDGRVAWRYLSTHVQDRPDPGYVLSRCRRVVSGESSGVVN